MDDQGYVYFHGRGDETYKQNGFRVSAAEVETAALDIPEVREAALLVPQHDHPAVLAVVGSIDSAVVLAGLRARLEEFKIPHEVVLVDVLPRTRNGKLDKAALRQRLETYVA
jgi:acyl-coenzyme A synthetase/AMP-(fatty) acid ligase